MSEILNYLGFGLVALGAFCLFSAAVGVLKFPNFFARLHAAGLADSFGLPLVLLGLMCLDGFTILSLKLLALLLISLLTSPTACHALAQAAHFAGRKNDN